jgi:hypothetical protein
MGALTEKRARSGDWPRWALPGGFASLQGAQVSPAQSHLDSTPARCALDSGRYPDGQIVNKFKFPAGYWVAIGRRMIEMLHLGVGI